MTTVIDGSKILRKVGNLFLMDEVLAFHITWLAQLTGPDMSSQIALGEIAKAIVNKPEDEEFGIEDIEQLAQNILETHRRVLQNHINISLHARN